MEIQAIDLFCGAGGLSFGLSKAGISVKAGLDNDPKCRYPYTENLDGAEFLLEDLTKTPSESLARFYDSNITLLAGCAPCQPFSTLSNGTDRKTSKKWPLLNEFLRLVRDLKPTLITMENVPALKSQSIFQDFVSGLKELGYDVRHYVVDAADYGVPQRRRRLVLLASKFGPIRLLSPQEMNLGRRTVRDAIFLLPEIGAGESCESDRLHKSRFFTDLNLRRIRASKPGGTWQDWPDELKLACHKKESGATFKSVYGRLEWDKPSATMTTQSYNFGTGRYGHPEQDRALSLREMAVLQSFPPDYKFVPEDESVENTSLGRMIGNAVPVDLGYAIGLSLVHHARQFVGEEDAQHQ